MGEASAVVSAPPRVSRAAPSERIGKTEFNPAAHGLRGVASMMVFCAHILGGTAIHIYQDNPSYVAAVAGMWHFGRYGVELFFAISGFVILPSVLRYAPVEFALRRFLRLYPLFLVLTLLFAALNAATNSYPELNSPEAVVAGLLFLNLLTDTDHITPTSSGGSGASPIATACWAVRTRRKNRPS